MFELSGRAVAPRSIWHEVTAFVVKRNIIIIVRVPEVTVVLASPVSVPFASYFNHESGFKIRVAWQLCRS
jgi:hypothetical protein